MSDAYKVEFCFPDMSISTYSRSKSKAQAVLNAAKYLEGDLVEHEEPIEYIKVGTIDEKGEWTNDKIII